MNIISHINSLASDLMKHNNFDLIIDNLKYFTDLDENFKIREEEFIKLFTYCNILVESMDIKIGLLSNDIILWSKNYSLSKELIAMFKLASYKLKTCEHLYNQFKNEIKIIFSV